VWRLDRSNSGDLIDMLRPHARNPDWAMARVGEGWRPLVKECHERLAAVLPDYELLDIKQKDGILDYQAFPHPWREGERSWNRQEWHDLGVITSDIQRRSESMCEGCGSPASLREWRRLVLTLCDACDSRFPDPPVPRTGRPW
jgi:hypothetical protein